MHRGSNAVRRGSNVSKNDFYSSSGDNPYEPKLGQQASRLQRSKLLTQKSSAVLQVEEPYMKRLMQSWKSIKGFMPIWMCRTLCFVQVYCYHDIQSVFLLIWIVHSTLFRDPNLFRKWIIFCYLPLVISIFLWYYVINIFGLLAMFDNPDFTDQKFIDNYTYGFF